MLKFRNDSVINSPWSVAAECIARSAWIVHSRRWSQYRDFAYSTKSAFDAPLRGSLSEYRYKVWYWKTRMIWIPDDAKRMRIRLFVLTEFTNVTDRHRMTASAALTYHRAAKSNFVICALWSSLDIPDNVRSFAMASTVRAHWDQKRIRRIIIADKWNS